MIRGILLVLSVLLPVTASATENQIYIDLFLLKDTTNNSELKISTRLNTPLRNFEIIAPESSETLWNSFQYTANSKEFNISPTQAGMQCSSTNGGEISLEYQVYSTNNILNDFSFIYTTSPLLIAHPKFAFFLPKNDDVWETTICLTLESHPEITTCYNKTSSIKELQSTYIALGNISAFEMDNLFVQIDNSLLKKLDSSQSLMTFIDNTITTQDSFWGVEQRTPVHICLLHSEGNLIPGRYRGNSLLASVPPVSSQEDFDTFLRVVTHELFHRYLGTSKFNLTKAPLSKELLQHSKAVVEGLTDFYALQHLFYTIQSNSEDRCANVLKSITTQYCSYAPNINKDTLLDRLQNNEAAVTTGTHLLIRRWLQEGTITQEQLDTFARSLPEYAVNAHDLYELMESYLGGQVVNDFQYFIVEGHDVLEGMKKPLTFRGSHFETTDFN